MIKSKRGRKPKNKIVDMSNQELSNQELSNQELSNKMKDNQITDLSNIVIPKKRGRKPKGGKIVENLSNTIKKITIVPNIILHLNCTLIDVNKFFNSNEIYNPEISDIKTYNEIDNKIFTPNYEILNDKNNDKNKDLDNSVFKSYDKSKILDESKTLGVSTINNTFFDDIKKISQYSNTLNNNSNINTKDNIIENKKSLSKLINEKLIELSYKLHNNITDGKSACFWCTCNFDTPNIYIPKTMSNDKINVYGCFCTPECATAYLMNENLDISTKYERYYLLNNVYNKIYNYKKLIKPAPNPYYILDKFCGNLTIEEYRNLFNEDNLIIIVNKPLTCVYPELFKDNNNTSNITNMNNNTYNINRYN